jgi:hypothetical protein
VEVTVGRSQSPQSSACSPLDDQGLTRRRRRSIEDAWGAFPAEGRSGADERCGEQSRAERRWAGRLIREVSFGDRRMPGVPSAFGLGCTRAVPDAARMLAALVTGSTWWLRAPPALARSSSPGLLLPLASQSR